MGGNVAIPRTHARAVRAVGRVHADRGRAVARVPHQRRQARRRVHAVRSRTSKMIRRLDVPGRHGEAHAVGPALREARVHVLPQHRRALLPAALRAALSGVHLLRRVSTASSGSCSDSKKHQTLREPDLGDGRHLVLAIVPLWLLLARRARHTSACATARPRTIRKLAPRPIIVPQLRSPSRARCRRRRRSRARRSARSQSTRGRLPAWQRCGRELDRDHRAVTCHRDRLLRGLVGVATSCRPRTICSADLDVATGPSRDRRPRGSGTCRSCRARRRGPRTRRPCSRASRRARRGSAARLDVGFSLTTWLQAPRISRLPSSTLRREPLGSVGRMR